MTASVKCMKVLYMCLNNIGDRILENHPTCKVVSTEISGIFLLIFCTLAIG